MSRDQMSFQRAAFWIPEERSQRISFAVYLFTSKKISPYFGRFTKSILPYLFSVMVMATERPSISSLLNLFPKQPHKVSLNNCRDSRLTIGIGQQIDRPSFAIQETSVFQDRLNRQSKGA